MNATSLFLATFLITATSFTPVDACGDDYGAALRATKLAKELVRVEDPAKIDEAIQELRAIGPMGLHTLLALVGKDISEGPPSPLAALKPNPRQTKLRAIVDRVAGQKDAHASKLFWYENFDAAKAAARETHRPILSLRLLGRLDEDLSCANSRFFRSALYANKEIADMLRQHFVLHWKTVRPVPVITIDFGDGRKICRTITGNSIHYVLDSNGKPLDALPGLYGPKAFGRHLDEARALFTSLAQLDTPAAREQALRQWHVAMALRSDKAWIADLEAIGRPIARHVRTSTEAGAAAKRAEGKYRVEAPVLAKLGHATALRELTDDPAWTAIAARHAEDARLDDTSRALMRAKGVDAATAMRIAVSKRVVEDPMLKAFRNFERSMAVDTVKNEYDLHRTIHHWFVDGEVGAVDALNERVYAQLFRTPSSDPWLGLVPADTYAGLDGAGLVTSK